MGDRKIEKQLILENSVSADPYDFFDAEMEKLVPSGVDKVCAAVSGGSDSMCLLWLLRGWCREHGVDLFCVTVDHQLRPESLDEAEFVRDVCQEWSIKHEILTWFHDNILIDHGKLENMAREARYGLISGYCTKHGIHFVCVAHNWDDQLETYELRKNFVPEKKVSIGLAGMSQVRSLTSDLKLVRPTLHFTKQCMRNILLMHCIKWKNDPMNEDESYKRVQCRKMLLKCSDETKQRMTDEILEIGEHRHLTESVAVSILRKSVRISRLGYAHVWFNDFIQWPPEVQREIVRRLLWTIGGKKYPPTISDRFLRSLSEKHTEVLWNCLAVYKKKRLMIFRECRNIELIQWNNIDKTKSTIIWDNRFLIDVPIVNALLQNYSKNVGNEGDKPNFIFTNDDVSSTDNLPREVIRTLPQIATERGILTLNSGIKFMEKVNLFDVFV